MLNQLLKLHHRAANQWLLHSRHMFCKCFWQGCCCSSYCTRSSDAEDLWLMHLLVQQAERQPWHTVHCRSMTSKNTNVVLQDSC
jgi:hypothetical protein